MDRLPALELGKLRHHVHPARADRDGHVERGRAGGRDEVDGRVERRVVVVGEDDCDLDPAGLVVEGSDERGVDAQVTRRAGCRGTSASP